MHLGLGRNSAQTCPGPASSAMLMFNSRVVARWLPDEASERMMYPRPVKYVLSVSKFVQRWPESFHRDSFVTVTPYNIIRHFTPSLRTVRTCMQLVARGARLCSSGCLSVLEAPRPRSLHCHAQSSRCSHNNTTDYIWLYAAGHCSCRSWHPYFAPTSTAC